MIKQSLIQGYTALDNCYKYTDSDSTIDCYAFTRDALSKPLKTAEPALNTNLVYALIGQQNNKDMVYVGQASRNTKPLARILQHMNTQASTKEKYYDYWQLALIFVCKNTNPADQWGTDTIDDLEALLIKDTQVECSWNSKEERIRNPLSLDRIRSHSRKLLDIREYVNNLEFNFFNKADKHENSSNTTYEERLDAEEKQLIDNTVNLTTINLEPTASVPEYTTPESVVNQMLDSLPWEEFNEATKFFDPACKGGEFLALIHDRMMKRLYEIGYKSDLAEPERMIRVHEHIVNKQLFGIAVGNNSYKVAKERAYSCPNIIKAPDNYIANLKKATYRYMGNKEKGKKTEMKFDVVIGNPPYQEATQSIYQHFINWSLTLSNKVCMITKDNWMTSDTLADTRANMISAGITDIYHYPIVGELFTNVTPTVTIFNIDREIGRDTTYVQIKNGKEVERYTTKLHGRQIIFEKDIEQKLFEKVRNAAENDCFSQFTEPSECFRITPNGEIGRTKQKLNDFQDKSPEHSIYVIYMGSDKSPYYRYININDIPARTDLINAYKVVSGRILSKDEIVIRNINMTNNNSVCTSSWAVLYSSIKRDNAINASKYIKTKFFRSLVRIMTEKGTIVPSQYRFSLVPNQNFTSDSDIDWSQSITNIDQQLYKKYNLTDNEIAYIEGTVKSMDTEPKQPQQPKYTLQDAMANSIYKQLNP